MHEKLQSFIDWVSKLIHPTIFLITDSKSLIAIRKHGVQPRKIIKNKDGTIIIETE